MDQTVYLTLQNGRVFAGRRFGAEADVTGELVFTTSMVGYLETLTDPAYCGQIVLQTFPLIGNYGVIPADVEGAQSHLKAYIVKEWCQEPSNFRCEGDLDAFLKARGIPGLYGIDTRAVTRIIREEGVMNARISSRPLTEEEVKALADYRITGCVQALSCKAPAQFPVENAARRVAVWDMGSSAGIVAALNKRRCSVTLMPAASAAKEILDLNVQGVVISGGAGDPAENTAVIAQIKALCEAKIPVFGIGLGHQLLALAQGGRTCKMKYGHRGSNQPAREAETGRVYITTQNCGYAVDADHLPANASVFFTNGNDGTVEGLRYTDLPACSVQFHPEACGGPQDTVFLFDRFVQLMDRNTRG